MARLTVAAFFSLGFGTAWAAPPTADEDANNDAAEIAADVATGLATDDAEGAAMRAGAVGGIGHNGRDTDAYSGTDMFFVIEPSASATLEVVSNFFLSVELGYRLAYDVNVPGLSDSSGTSVVNVGGLDLGVSASMRF